VLAAVQFAPLAAVLVVLLCLMKEQVPAVHGTGEPPRAGCSLAAAEADPGLLLLLLCEVRGVLQQAMKGHCPPVHPAALPLHQAPLAALVPAAM
jgi:hypothetical protein